MEKGDFGCEEAFDFECEEEFYFVESCANGFCDFSGANLIWFDVNVVYDLLVAFRLDPNFNDLNFKDSKWFGLDLRKFSFQRCNLSEANFIRADLRGVDFTGSRLVGANLRYANCEGACFKDARLDRKVVEHLLEGGFKDFQGCILNDVDLSGLDLSGCDFSGAKLGNQKSPSDSQRLFTACVGRNAEDEGVASSPGRCAHN